jgi:hypothetical protein
MDKLNSGYAEQIWVSVSKFFFVFLFGYRDPLDKNVAENSRT